MDVINSMVTDDYAIYNGDSCSVLSDMPDDSVHFSVYSPPFASKRSCLYTYSSDERDLSNNDYDQFFEHYEFIVSQVSRLTLPGRCTAVHCTDIPSSNSGKDYLIDFPGDIIRLHEKHDFKMIARHTIWKEPLWVRNRTMTHNLSHRTIVDDAVYGGVASADYLLVFRKKGENKIPVSYPTGLTHYAGECTIPDEFKHLKNFKGDQKKNRYSHWIWRRYASSVWDDIDMSNVLPFVDCKEPDDEKHVHPLQLDIVERAVILRSNPNEIVLTPFMGVGSEVYSAVKLHRKGVGIELKSSYYRQSVKNVESALQARSNNNNQMTQGSLF